MRTCRLSLLSLKHAQAHREHEDGDNDEEHDHVHRALELAPGASGRHCLRDRVEVVVCLVVIAPAGEAAADEGPRQHVGVKLCLVGSRVHTQDGAVCLDAAERTRLAEEEAYKAPAHALCLFALHEAVLDGYELEHALHELAARDVYVRVRGNGGRRTRCRSGTHAQRESKRTPRRPIHLCSAGALSYIRLRAFRSPSACYGERHHILISFDRAPCGLERGRGSGLEPAQYIYIRDVENLECQ